MRFNILVTGTPGTGKSTLAEELAIRCNLKHVDVGKMIKERSLFQEWDEERNCSIFDEDAVEDAVGECIEKENCVVEFHSPSVFPKDFFDLVVVLRTDNTILYDRLKARDYSTKKIQENVECEIFRVVADEVHECYEDVRIVEAQNDVLADMGKICDDVTKIIQELADAQ